MLAKSRSAFAVLVLATVTAPALADFVSPNEYGWSRQTANTTYFEWNVFTSPVGGNTPDIGQFPNPLPEGWVAADVVETTGTAFVTSGGNIYSFAAATEFEVTFPNYAQGKSWSTDVLVQVRTLGSELEYATVRLAGVAAAERIELDRQVLGGMGGFQVDTLLRFELTGNVASYTLEFNAAASSMSLDRLAIDSRTQEEATCRADFNADGVANSQDFFSYLTAFFAIDPTADFNRDGTVNSQDFFDFLNTFFLGC